MKAFRSLIFSATNVLSRESPSPRLIRAVSANPFPGSNGREMMNSSESVDGFEKQIYGVGDMSSFSSFYQKLEGAEKARNQSGKGYPFGNMSGTMDGLDENFSTTLTDGMESKLQKAATYFEFDPQEVTEETYSFRPDVNFPPGNSYDTKDLDVRKPGVRKPIKRFEFETTTAEVLQKADFRNVKFLANFITEAGIINKRSKTGISAKAQRKIAREIKTARAFGLMPFTSMGTKQFVYGATMEDDDRDFEYDVHDINFVDENVGDA